MQGSRILLAIALVCMGFNAHADPTELQCQFEGREATLVVNLKDETVREKGASSVSRITSQDDRFIVAQRSKIVSLPAMDGVPSNIIAISTTWYISRSTGQVRLVTIGSGCTGEVACVLDDLPVSPRTFTGFCDRAF